MSPKEKAKELFAKYTPDLVNKLGISDETFELNIKFAIIAVDEILSINNERMYQLSGVKETFYKEVKTELEKL